MTIETFTEALIAALQRAPQMMLTGQTLSGLLREIVPAPPPTLQKYPRYFHSQKVVNFAPAAPARLVQSQEEEAALGPDWGRTPPPTHADGFPRWASFHYPGAGAPSPSALGDPSHPERGAITTYTDAERTELLAKGLVPSMVLVNDEAELDALAAKGKGWI